MLKHVLQFNFTLNSTFYCSLNALYQIHMMIIHFGNLKISFKNKKKKKMKPFRAMKFCVHIDLDLDRLCAMA